MFLNSEKMVKMSEAYIHKSYSEYLQNVTIVAAQLALVEVIDDEVKTEYYLTYEEFKEYYLSQLLGKDNYLATMISSMQQSISEPKI